MLVQDHYTWADLRSTEFSVTRDGFSFHLPCIYSSCKRKKQFWQKSDNHLGADMLDPVWVLDRNETSMRKQNAQKHWERTGRDNVIFWFKIWQRRHPGVSFKCTYHSPIMCSWKGSVYTQQLREKWSQTRCRLERLQKKAAIFLAV